MARAWIVTPVYRDVRSFLVLRRLLLEYLDPIGRVDVESARFVVIDDTAGQDPQIGMLSDCEDVTVLRPPFNLGHQRAIVYALRKVMPEVHDDDVIVTLDADGEDRPADLPRLLAALWSPPRGERWCLARRTKRKESFRFKVMYVFFRVLFKALTGTTVRSGNYAATSGSLARRALLHPSFDLSYSSALLAVDVPIAYVPCERGERYDGESRMTFPRLTMHGLRMLMPFADRIAVRALGVFALSLVFGAVLALAIVCIRVFTDSAIPGWASFTVLGAVIVSLVALGNFVTLFILFSQTRAVSLANVEDFSGESEGHLR